MREEKIYPHWNLNHGPLEPKSSVLLISYPDPLFNTWKFGQVWFSSALID